MILCINIKRGEKLNIEVANFMGIFTIKKIIRDKVWNWNIVSFFIKNTHFGQKEKMSNDDKKDKDIKRLVSSLNKYKGNRSKT